ncbi:branched-chain amino acid ABC transporter permease [Pusillimonas caeni]|uniref:branched-chain amino acid ABC transporter permease n=1 Tax=Pusillimonas caeni TaxID=1348472 RepID=UPI000E5A057D|nr:branched-chain amino acid ABC transporter permease [Pusillimonas caeni]TFL14869.1 branched-chain amino acid ABC transporter permease [Pusillimonas caeni]
MNATIAIMLTQDGLTNGLLYALIGLSILQVFLVTRVLWVPAGEVVALAALTMGVLNTGKVPGMVWLLPCIGLAAMLSWLWSAWRARTWRGLGGQLLANIVYPVAAGALVAWMAPMPLSPLLRGLLTLLLVAPLGPLLYTAVFRPILHTSVLTKLIVAVALHTVLTGAGLYFFGAEGLRSAPIISGRLDVGFTRLSYQLILVAAVSLVLMIALWLFFERSLWGKALRATAMNRLGARLVAIRIQSSGLIAFGIAGFIGALAGVLISPITTVYYDSGFLLALKGFIGVVCAGMVSFPLTVLGALGVGVLDAFASFYTSSMRDVIVFSALVPILMWRSLYAHHGDDES